MIRVNLLKSEAKAVEKKGVGAAAEPKTEKSKKNNIGNLVVFLAIVVVGALAFFQKQALDGEKALLSAAQEEQRVLTPVLEKLDLVEQQKEFLQKKVDLIEELRNKQAVPLHILDTLTRGLPDWVWLTEANLNGRALTLKGRALSNLQVSDYMNALQRSGLFSEVSIVSTQQINVGPNNVQEYTLNALLPAPAAKTPEAK
jgi:type IV pilus assembly protein PilN